MRKCSQRQYACRLHTKITEIWIRQRLQKIIQSTYYTHFMDDGCYTSIDNPNTLCVMKFEPIWACIHWYVLHTNLKVFFFYFLFLMHLLLIATYILYIDLWILMAVKFSVGAGFISILCICTYIGLFFSRPFEAFHIQRERGFFPQLRCQSKKYKRVKERQSLWDVYTIFEWKRYSEYR